MKKIVSLLIVFAMLVGMVPAVFAADSAVQTYSSDTLSGTIVAEAEEEYTVEWTAPDDGVLTVSATGDPGFWFKWDGGIYEWNLTTYSADYAVTAGTTYVLTFKCMDGFSNADGTIDYALTFAAGASLKEAYAICEQTIVEAGTHTIDMIETAKVTIVAVTPSETGYYTISVPEGALIANCGGGAFYIYDWSTVSPATSFEWVCEEAGYWSDVEVDTGTTDADGNPIYETVNMYTEGQTLMLGIVSDSDTVDVTVTKTADYAKETVELQEYVNKAELSQFTLPEGAVPGSYVDVYGDTHTAVLGDDGYYHLDSADGDILLVDMDYLFQLSGALQSERPVMYAYVTDDNGKVIEKWDIGNAVLAYEAVCDENMYYPLTEDLIFFYDTYAAGNGVLDYALGMGYNEECAWMYACLTMTLPETETPDTGDGEDEALEGTEENPIIIDAMPYLFYADFANADIAFWGYFYQYTAEKDGTLEIADVYDDFNTGVISVVTAEGEYINLTESGYDVKAGEVLLLCHWAYAAGEHDVTLQYAEETSEDPTDPEEPVDPEDPTEPEVPDEGEWSGENVEVAADETIVITYTPETDGVLTVEISSVTGWQINIMDEFNEESAWSDTHTSPVTYNLVAGTTYTITLIPYDQADGWTTCDAVMSYNITFTPAQETPDIPVDGTFVDGNNYMELPADDEDGLACYEYIATQTGTLYIVATYMGWDYNGTGEYSEDTASLAGNFRDLTSLTVNGQALEGYYYGAIEVVAGETYTFVWEDIVTWNANYGWDAVLNLSYTDDLVPVYGTAELPIELNFYVDTLPKQTIEIAPGTTAYYVLYSFYGTTFTVTGDNAYVIVESEVGGEVTQLRYDADNGVVKVPITGYGACNIQIGNDGTSAATFTMDANYPVGSWENPDTNMAIGNNLVVLEEGGIYVYNWTAPCNGSLTITVSGQYWDYCVTNLYSGASGGWNNFYGDPQVSSVTVSFAQGDVIEITIATYKEDADGNYSYPASVVNFTAEVDYTHEYGEPVYHEATCGVDAYTEYTCAICGETHTEVEEGTALVHNYVDGKCTNCGGYEYIVGDVDMDGDVDTSDAFLIVQYYSKRDELTPEQLKRANVDGDNDVDTSDAYWIVQYYTKQIESFPNED